MADTTESLETLQSRLRTVSRTFVSLADTLVADFDVADFLNMLTEQCTDLLDVSAAGVILRDADGSLRVAATSSQRAELLELFAVQTDDGPCLDCVRSGAPVSCTDLPAEARRWPRFTAAAAECGFRAVQALPMRLRDQVVGALTLLNTEAVGAGPEEIELGQALADVATIGILQQRNIERGDQLTEQLQTALTSRVVIEQAKGILAEHGAVSVDEAFTRLRGFARARHLRLTDLARAVAGGNVDLAAILKHPQR
ncbi:GAF and ANTAR domain-containing protein [Amycolatopsis sp. WQ 127309]|uniref:GAF and ANTAR domain-containing protein n=1 Tax=Amycolatopsis sp. WQ 127309 TaxID=2932773 RepID=UPI001FF14628|nr:GAF and ANTAR domain-containing protein [Amycolatopsis sp. WQ 127309]UOZ04907.1 GAF and ANTAR domain-containing protein [Amycolatopsis sp. WQ 127309]